MEVMLELSSHIAQVSGRPGVNGALARALYDGALACLERAELRRAQTKLRLALAHDPFFDEARRALDRLLL